MKVFSFLALMFLRSGLALASSGPEVNYYRDIDYWTLEGIDEIPQSEINKYPYFKIQKLDKVNRVVESVSDSGSYKEHYVWKDSSWTMINERSGNTSHVYQYTYIFENRILTVDYLAVLSFDEGKGPSPRRLAKMQRRLRNNRHFLVSLSVRDSNSRMDYTLSRSRKIWDSPGRNIYKNFKNLEVETVVKRTYRVVGDILLEEKSKVQSDTDHVDLICYNLNDKRGYKHNLFWPMFFPERINCE